MRNTSPARFGRATVLAVFLSCCAPLVASAVEFTLRHNTGGTALRGDNFQSHNQNIVWTSGGLFRSGDYQDWPNGSDNVVVQRSTDGGRNWSLLYDTGVHRDNLKPPTIEADPAGNVYIVYPSESSSTRFVKFSPSNNYSSPVVNANTGAAGSASKFASAFDPGRNRLYHATQWGRLLEFNTSGGVEWNKHLITDGGDSRPSYPHVMVDEFGVIHYAMTVADGGDDVPYTDIRYMKSLDGGQTWKAMNGTTISTPTGAAGGSGATLINRSGEHNYASWLANMYVKDGKVHFIYQTHNPWDPAGAGNPPPISPYMSYIRYDEATGTREIDRTTLEGNSYSINSEAASFASDTSNSTGALYVVSERSDGKRLQALVSYDNGQTWQDYAQSAYHGLIANPSLARSVTPDGKVIGGVALDDPYWAWVHHLELPTAQDTTTLAYWDGGGEYSDWDRAANWVGNVEPTFDNKLAVAIGSGSSTAKFDTMRIDGDRTVRALIFGTHADADVNLRLKNSTGQSRTLTFESNVTGGSAEINVHHDATGNIDIGGGDGLGNVVLNDPLRVNHNGSGMLTISRPISGSHTITKYGDGQFALSGDNSGFSGKLDIQQGKLALVGSGSENGVPDVHVASGATLSLGNGFVGGTATIGNLTGAGRVDPQFGSNTGTRTLQVNQTTNGTFSGVLTNATSGANRVLALGKTGAATLTLSGENTYTGPTTVGAGSLRVDGSIAASALTTVAGGATLRGNGTVGPLTLQGGTVAPGASIGALSAADTTWTDGSSYRFEIDDVAGTAGAPGGPGWDLLDIAGTLDLTGLSAGGFTVELATLLPGGGTNPGMMAQFDNLADYSWEFARTSDGVLGYSAELFTVDTTAFTNEFAGDFGVRHLGNSLYVTYSPIPEPSSGLSLLLGLAFMICFGRRRSTLIRRNLPCKPCKPPAVVS